MSLAANIRNGCNRLVGENDIVTINIIQFDIVSCKRDFLNNISIYSSKSSTPKKVL